MFKLLSLKGTGSPEENFKPIVKRLCQTGEFKATIERVIGDRTIKTTYNLESCTVLNEHNTVFTQSGPLYATGVSLGPPESSTQVAS